MPLSNEAKDKYVAPEISAFTKADMPDVSSAPEQGHWLNNYVLNAMRRGDFPDPARQFVFNYLRRTVGAFREYSLARERAQGYLANTDSITAYIDAVAHWEVYLSQAWHACLLLERFSGIKKSWFTPGDGSAHERLNWVYNSAKHAESAIENRETLLGATMPMWLANDGLRTVTHTLLYTEDAEILQDLSDWANILQDPVTTEEKLRTVASAAGSARKLDGNG